MTTNVDILFREQSVSNAVNERKAKPLASSTEHDYSEDSSSVSKKDRTTEKSFTDHLNDQSDKKTTAANEGEISTDYQSKKPTENSEVINKDTATPNQPSKTNDSPTDGHEITVIIKKETETNVAAHILDNKVGQVSSFSNLDKIKSVTLNNRDLPSENAITEKSATAIKELSENITQTPNSSAITTSSGQTNAITNPSIPYGISGKSEKIAKEAVLKVPTDHAVKVDDAIKVVSTPTNTGAPTIITNAPSEVIVDPVINEAASNAPTQVKSENDVTKTVSTINSDADILNGNKTNNPPADANANAPHNDDIKQEPVTFISHDTSVEKYPLDMVIQSAGAAIETARTISAVPAQNQSGNQTAVTANKNGGNKSNSKNANTANLNSGNTATTQNTAQNSTPQISNPNLIKSDVSLDLGIGNQNFDTALSQNLNGQTSLSTGSAIAAQDVSGLKTISGIASTMKAEAPVTPKMINEQITIAINKNIQNGKNNFSIRLNPAELGKVDIKLEFMADGKMQAAMTVESEKTLTMLQRDQSTLEKALSDAGIDLADKNMNFSLMKQNQKNKSQQFAEMTGSSNDDDALEELVEVGTVQEIRMGYSTKTIDISV